MLSRAEVAANPRSMGNPARGVPESWDPAGAALGLASVDMKRDDVRRLRGDIARLGSSDLDWVTFATRASEALRRVVPFDRNCWHPVDPGTTLFTGSLVRNMACDGAWLARYEYVVPDVNKWAFLAHSGYRAGSLSRATHGNLDLSARHRSSEGSFGDELRCSFVSDGSYWGATGLIRDPDQPWFNEEEVRLLASLSPLLAEGFRNAILSTRVPADESSPDAPGVVIFDEKGSVESISPTAERWLMELAQVPVAESADESHVLQAVAARARRADSSAGGPELPARVRVQTLSGQWLILDGMRLTGRRDDRFAVMIQPAPPQEIASLIVEAYGLSEREREITLLLMSGMSTKEIATAAHISPYTVQDHLKSIFEKTGARSRAELVGQVFLEHYVPRFKSIVNPPAGWLAQDGQGDVPAKAETQL
jgi:DNA-binding CsgD family transcriptional regulator